MLHTAVFLLTDTHSEMKRADDDKYKGSSLVGLVGFTIVYWMSSKMSAVVIMLVLCLPCAYSLLHCDEC